MRQRIRLTTVLPLLVAFLVAGLLPAAGSWSCPDGTACVYTAGRGFHCVGDHCRMSCCAAGRSAAGCRRCEPAARPSAAAPRGAHPRQVSAPDRCRYRDARPLAAVWLRPQSAPNVRWHASAALPARITAPAVSALWTRCAPTRGSPPSSRSIPPRSPRAPPAPHCA